MYLRHALVLELYLPIRVCSVQPMLKIPDGEKTTNNHSDDAKNKPSNKGYLTKNGGSECEWS